MEASDKEGGNKKNLEKSTWDKKIPVSKTGFVLLRLLANENAPSENFPPSKGIMTFFIISLYGYINIYITNRISNEFH